MVANAVVSKRRFMALTLHHSRPLFNNFGRWRARLFDNEALLLLINATHPQFWFTTSQTGALPPAIRQLDGEERYPVTISESLRSLARQSDELVS